MERTPQISQDRDNSPQRELLTACFLTVACLFFVLTLAELLAENPALSAMGALAAVICAGNAIYTWMRGISGMFTRISVAIGITALVTSLSMHGSGLPLVLSLLAPCALIYLFGPIEALLWSIAAFGSSIGLHRVFMPDSPTNNTSCNWHVLPPL